ncbi:TonB family protein [Fluviicola sp.]|uniref:TonB family protein n=1 Tax=Fluviicola sp. TaxID=1917219 RepID=UPI0031D5D946
MRILLFFILVTSSFTFGQSAKKLNLQLRTELVAEQEKQDSAFGEFSKEKTRFQRTEKELEQYIKDSLFERNQKLKELRSSIRGSLRTLKELEIDTKDVFPDDPDFDSHPKYSVIKTHLLLASENPVKFLDVSEEDTDWKGLKLKEQNEVLKEKIKKYQTYAAYNRIYFQDQLNDIREIEAIRPQVDSLARVYDALSLALEEKAALLEKRIYTARENYRAKGPKGFPDAYSYVFPDVHPVIHEVHDRKPGDETGYPSQITAWESKEVPIVVEELDLRIYDIVDEVASFPGGTGELKKYLDEKLVYPAGALEKGLYGKTFLKFVVSKSGKISDVVLKRGVPDCPECDEEAKRLVKSMPDWIPAKKDGKNVHSYAYLPVTFRQ